MGPILTDYIKNRCIVWGKKKGPRKLSIFNQNNMKLLYIYIYLSTKGRVSSSLILKIACEQLSFHIGMGSLPLTRIFHEEHNDTYCNLPSTFFLDKFASKSHS